MLQFAGDSERCADGKVGLQIVQELAAQDNLGSKPRWSSLRFCQFFATLWNQLWRILCSLVRHCLSETQKCLIATTSLSRAGAVTRLHVENNMVRVLDTPDSERARLDTRAIWNSEYSWFSYSKFVEAHVWHSQIQGRRMFVMFSPQDQHGVTWSHMESHGACGNPAAWLSSEASRKRKNLLASPAKVFGSWLLFQHVPTVMWTFHNFPSCWQGCHGSWSWQSWCAFCQRRHSEEKAVNGRVRTLLVHVPSYRGSIGALWFMPLTYCVIVRAWIDDRNASVGDGWTAESVGVQLGFKGKISISTTPQQGVT